jgi:hypothetical protein
MYAATVRGARISVTITMLGAATCAYFGKKVAAPLALALT